jgi:SAM-dependent methyltransferase
VRLAGRLRMGHYPTPPVVSAAIARSITPAAPGLLRTLDPCCGDGAALRQATAALGTTVERYGIELHQARAQVARGVLTRVLHADIRGTRIANAAFGFILLNPPYDFDTKRELDEATARLELVFLQASLRFLQPGGLLVYLIPDKRLGTRLAKLLAYHLQDIQVFRFPCAEYERFSQIIVFGVRKPTPFQEEPVIRTLQAIGHGLVTPPELPEALPVPYRIPVAFPGRQLLFQSLSVDPQDLLQEIETTGAYPAFLRQLAPQSAAQRLRPLMPLRRGHLALVLASGHLNNELVRDPRTGHPVLIKGRTEKEVARTEATEADGTRVITERDVLTIVITALDLTTGKIQTLQ